MGVFFTFFVLLVGYEILSLMFPCIVIVVLVSLVECMLFSYILLFLALSIVHYVVVLCINGKHCLKLISLCLFIYSIDVGVLYICGESIRFWTWSFECLQSACIHVEHYFMHAFVVCIWNCSIRSITLLLFFPSSLALVLVAVWT